MKLGVRLTTKFKKDADRINRQGKNLDKMYEIIEKLRECKQLPSQYRDHELTGGYADCRECHIEPDLAFNIQNRKRGINFNFDQNGQPFGFILNTNGKLLNCRRFRGILTKQAKNRLRSHNSDVKPAKREVDGSSPFAPAKSQRVTGISQ
jgi:mRNA interferase YafQ